MANLQGTNRRIIGVRANSAAPLIFCEAGEISPGIGDWVIIERESEIFPAQVALPDRLLEADQLGDDLPWLVRLASEADLAAAGKSSALTDQVARQFAAVSAAHNMPYQLKEARVWPDHLVVRFSAGQELTAGDYVLILKGLAEVYPARIELFRVSEAAPAPTGDNLVNWVNGLLVELDPTILERAAVGQPLLDETAVYRPGQRPSAPPPAPPEPAAVYDPSTKILSVGGQQLNPPG